MRHFQPTVRQLQPLGRRYDSAPIGRERVATQAREPVTDSPDATTSVPPRAGVSCASSEVGGAHVSQTTRAPSTIHR